MTNSLSTPPFRWSFSQWEAYYQCPAKWAFRHRHKIPSKPPGPAAARGLEMHATVEEYIKGADAHVLHEAIHPKYIPILDEYRNHPNGDRYTEKKLAFDGEWYVVAHTSPNAACIAVLDACKFSRPSSEEPGVLDVAEWKSGKPKETHADQRKLYAIFGMRHWLAGEVRVTTYYLEDTEQPQRVVLKSQSGFETLKSLWESRVSGMLRDEMCAPRPGFYCRWCDYSRAAGGPCQFGG